MIESSPNYLYSTNILPLHFHFNALDWIEQLRQRSPNVTIGGVNSE